MKKALLSTIVLGLGLGGGFATYASPLTYAFANYTGQTLTAEGQTVENDQTVTLNIPKPDSIGSVTHTTPITATNGEEVATVQTTLECKVLPHKEGAPILISCQLTQLQATGINGYNGHSNFPGGTYVYVD